MQEIHEHLERIKHEITTPVIARIEANEVEVLQQFQQLPVEVAKNTRELFQQLQQFLPAVPAATRDVIESIRNLNECHRRILNVFLQSDQPDDLLSYEEIGARLALSAATVRGYVADLRRLGFPLTERREGRKVLIGMSNEAMCQLLAMRKT